MKILPDKVHSTVRDGSWLYAIVESYQLGLSTIRLGANGEGARLTNLFTVGIPSVGDMVVVDFSASRPYVRCLIMDEEEEPEEELMPVIVLTGAKWQPVCQHQASFNNDAMWSSLVGNENTGDLAFGVWWNSDDSYIKAWISKDGGDSWNGLDAVHMDSETLRWLNNGVLISVAYNGEVAYSKDSGVSWDSYYAKDKNNSYIFCFAKDTGTFFYTIGDGKTLVRSYDYGKSYKVLATFSSIITEVQCSYDGGTIAVGIGSSTSIKLSFNSGTSWIDSYTPGQLYYSPYIFVSPDGSFIGIKCKGSPEGTWVTDNGLNYHYLADICVYGVTYIKSSNMTIVVGYNYDTYSGIQVLPYGWEAWMSTDGVSWEQVTLPQPTSRDEVFLVYDNARGILHARYSYCGGMYRSYNLGSSWEAVDPQLPESAWYVMPYCISGDGQFIFAFTIGVNTISRDGGKTWEDHFLINIGRDCMDDYYGQVYRAACSQDGTHVVFYDYVGCIFVSHDGMHSWSHKDRANFYFGEGEIQDHPASASVNNDGRVMAIGGDMDWTPAEENYISFDYGESWREIVLRSGAGFPYVSVSGDGSTIWFSGETGVFRMTGDGSVIEEMPSPGSGTIYQIHTNADGSIAVVDINHSSLYKYEGGSWTSILNADIQSDDGYNGFALDTTGKQIAVGIYKSDIDEYRVALSFDGGEHWQEENVDPDTTYYDTMISLISGNDFSKLIGFSDGWIWERIPEDANKSKQ